MCAILARRVHSLHVPTEFAANRGPLHVLSVSEASSVVRLVRNVEIKFFVGAANCANVLRVDRPVKGSDERVVFRKRLVQRVASLFVDRIHV